MISPVGDLNSTYRIGKILLLRTGKLEIWSPRTDPENCGQAIPRITHQDAISKEQTQSHHKIDVWNFINHPVLYFTKSGSWQNPAFGRETRAAQIVPLESNLYAHMNTCRLKGKSTKFATLKTLSLCIIFGKLLCFTTMQIDSKDKLRTHNPYKFKMFWINWL